MFPFFDTIKDLCKIALGEDLHENLHKAFSRFAEHADAHRLPPNHDLQHALHKSLSKATQSLAWTLYQPNRKKFSDVLCEAPPAEITKRILEAITKSPLDLKPETPDYWLSELLGHAKDAKQFEAFDLGPLLFNNQFTRLVPEFVDEGFLTHVHSALLRWVAELRMENPHVHPDFEQWVLNGWTLSAADGSTGARITFYEIFCIFFREELKSKDNEKVFKIFVADTLAVIKNMLMELHRAEQASEISSITFEQWRLHLDKQNGEALGILRRLEAGQRRLEEGMDALPDNVAKKVAVELRTILAEKGKTLADLSREELERELASRVPGFTQEDLHRLIGYARFKAELNRFDRYAPADLIGREAETAFLNDAWAKVMREEKSRPHVLTFVALGGEGKTSLVAKWAAELAHQDWPGCDAAFAWSFYRQGTDEKSAGSSDLFLKEALVFFGDTAMAESAQHAIEKAKRLARLVGQRRSLLILDGLEPLQYAPTSPTPGQLKDQGIAALLKGLAAASHGLCVVTTRYSLPDLKAFWQTTAPEVKLLRLSREAGVHLLKTLGVNGTAKEFETLVEDVKGHALTLTLLGGFLKRAFHGDIRQRDRVKFEKADEKMDGGHAFRTMAAYEQWLLRDGGEEGRREVAVLRLMGLFDRPADAGCLAALLQPPVIEGLTDPLMGIAEEDWNFSLETLESAKLLTVNRDASGALVSLDAHPHIREYFAAQLKLGSARASRAVSGALAGNISGEPDALESSTPSGQPAGARVGTREGACAPQTSDAWRAAHRRLYEHLCATTRDQPQPTLGDLQPLYQAVAHGCQAGLQQEACDKVYRDRILRGDEYYSWRKLGAIASNLGAVASFFEQPWSRVSLSLTEYNQAWLQNEATFYLGALGRLTDARETIVPMRAGVKVAARLSEQKKAAIYSGTLSELELTLGEVAGAVEDAEQSVTYADLSVDWKQRMNKRTTLADALHQAGRRAEAEARFREAEQMQAESQPDHPLLHLLWGFRYCDLLLTEAERAAWQICLGSARASRAVVGAPADHTPGESNVPGSATPSDQPAGARVGAREGTCAPQIQSCHAVSQRAEQTLQWVTVGDLGILDIALDHLTLGRAALYAAILESSCSDLGVPSFELDAAVSGLRRSGRQDELPKGLLTRAWLRCLTGARTGPESAQEDLDEAWEIAERGPMKLFLADIHLHRARLFFREKEYPKAWISPQADLAAAEQLIHDCGYHRRDEELADAKKAIGG